MYVRLCVICLILFTLLLVFGVSETQAQCSYDCGYVIFFCGPQGERWQFQKRHSPISVKMWGYTVYSMPPVDAEETITKWTWNGPAFSCQCPSEPMEGTGPIIVGYTFTTSTIGRWKCTDSPPDKQGS